MFKTDLDIGSDVKLARKLAKSMTGTSGKVHKSKTYDKAIDNPIYGNR